MKLEPQRLVLPTGWSRPCVYCGREATRESFDRGEIAAVLEERPDRLQVVAVVCADHFRGGRDSPEWRPATDAFAAAVSRYNREHN